MKYLALRIRQYNKLVDFLREQGVNVIHSRLETRDQALSNLTEGLFDQGVERVIEGHELRWMQVDCELDDQVIDTWSLCDLSLDVDWFDQYKSSIRHYSGVAYWDATYGLAKTLHWKPQDRDICYFIKQPIVNVVDHQQKVGLHQELELDLSLGEDKKQDLSVAQPVISQFRKAKNKSKKQEVKEFQLDLFG